MDRTSGNGRPDIDLNHPMGAGPTQLASLDGATSPSLTSSGTLQSFRCQHLKTASLLVAVIAVNFARRPDQFLHPAVWVEEGSVLFRQYLNRGWASIFTPVNGYILAPSKIVTVLAYHTSFGQYPAASVVWTLVVSSGVALAILKAPTFIKYRWIAAISPFLVPIHPEVLTAASYVFWQTSFLAILSLLWKFEARHSLLRMSYTIIGGLSSPLIVVLAPAFVLRCIVARRKSEVLPAVAAATTAAMQLRALAAAKASSNDSLSHSLKTPLTFVRLVVEKFFGDFVLNLDNAVSLVLGIAIVTYMLFVTFKAAKERDWGIFLLSYTIAATLVSVARVDIRVIDAFGNAPRYFYMTFVTLSWFWLSQIRSSQVQRLGAASLLVVASCNSSQQFVRRHDHLDWTTAASNCSLGKPMLSRRMTLPPSGPATRVTFSSSGAFSENDLREEVPYRSTSWGTSRSDGDVGRLVIDLPGDAGGHRVAIELIGGPSLEHQHMGVLLASGAAVTYDLSPVAASLKDWAWFDLPAARRIELIDDGTGWGEWIALSAVLPTLDGEPDDQPVYDLPVHYNGNKYDKWELFLTQSECKRFERMALF